MAVYKGPLMDAVQSLEDDIDDELRDARKYAEKALRFADLTPAAADLYAKLSAAEMDHMAMLHKCVVQLIDLYRREHGAPPDEVLTIYDYLHQRHIQAAADVARIQAMRE